MPQSPGTTWDRIPGHIRKAGVWTLWFVTWLALVAGLFDRRFYEVVVVFSAAHVCLVLALHRFRVTPFPVQLRLVYVVWVVIGTYVPYMTFLMYITTVGLPANLFFKYCPLARMMYLLPWNRVEQFSFSLMARVFLSPPVNGQFKPAPPAV